MEFAAIAKEMQTMTQEILDECPVRITGTEGCKRSAEIIADKLKHVCDEVQIETFETRPDAFLGFFKIIAVLTWISTPFVWLGGSWLWVAAIGFSIATLHSLFDFVFYKEDLDFLYKKATGYNVEGILEPPNPPKQQIIIAGHHDNIWVFDYIAKHQKLYAPRIIAGIACMIISTVLCWIWIIWESVSNNEPFFGWAFRIFTIFGIILTGNLFIFLGKQVTPGAGDNMIASMMAVKLAQIFGEAKKSGHPLVQHTRLRFHSTDGEESGLRGARAYVKTHLQELKEIPTYVLNVDSLYSIDQIHFLISDINGMQKLSKQMAADLKSIGESIGVSGSIYEMTFGGGGTDAAEFAKVGIEATTIVALPMEFMRDGLVYHTEKDTADILHLDTIEAVYKLVYEYILRKDTSIK